MVKYFIYCCLLWLQMKWQMATMEYILWVARLICDTQVMKVYELCLMFAQHFSYLIVAPRWCKISQHFVVVYSSIKPNILAYSIKEFWKQEFHDCIYLICTAYILFALLISQPVKGENANSFLLNALKFWLKLIYF